MIERGDSGCGRRPSLAGDGGRRGFGVGLGGFAFLFALDPFVVGALFLFEFALTFSVGVAVFWNGGLAF
jgi:hypothetical protein